MEITIEIKDRELRTALTALRARITHLRPVMTDIAVAMQNSVEKNFAQESARNPIVPAGAKRGAWADLAPATKKARARIKKYPGKKLQVTGRLINSITADADADSATVGTNLQRKGFLYPLALQEGTKKMPARPFLVVQAEDIRAIEEIIFRALQRAVR